MKKILFPILLMFAIIISGFSQVPDAFNYQSVVRNASGELIGNQDVSFKISILQDSESGTPVYVETHFITTNDFGIANLKIGQGTVQSGVFDPGAWGLNTHFLKLEIDAEGGSSYLHMGTSQLLSVPYAFHAQTVAEDQVDDADADASNELQTISLSGTDLTLSEGGGTVTLEDNQTLSIAGNDLSISDGNTVSIPDMSDDWGTQAVESNFSLTGDGTTASPLAVFGNLTDDQTLSLSGNNLTISSGNTVALPSSPWIQSGSNIYYNSGTIGVGITPDANRTIKAYSSSYANIEIISGSDNASFIATKSTSAHGAGVIFKSGTVNKFFAGLYGDDNYTITPSYLSKTGLEIEQDGDVNLSDELHSANTGTANMMPFAYGRISSTGDKIGCTPNVGVVTVIATGQYKLEIAGLDTESTVVVASVGGAVYYNSMVMGVSSTYISVASWDTKNDVYINAAFSFIVYKP